MILLQKVKSKVLTVIAYVTNTGYEWYMRKRLKNKDFTILSSNCIGGIIYHRLGLQFRSPTINLWMRQRDCMKLAADIDKYKRHKLRFVESEYSYPVAKLDDITIYFNHSADETSAADGWYRRMERINKDNIYLIIYDCEDLTNEEIMNMKKLPCKRCVLLTEKERPDIEFAKKMVPSGKTNGKQYLDRQWHGLHTFETQFDFVRWLNQ